MAVKPDTKPHMFYWTPLNNSQKQTTHSRCNECGSRANHPIHKTINHYTLCKACRGTGKHVDSDTQMQDVDGDMACSVCSGIGECV